MRKITSFFTMSLLVAGFTTAQADVLEELQGNQVVSVGSEVQTASDLSTDKWYLMYEDRSEEGFAWDRSYQVEGSILYKSSGTDVIDDGNTMASEAAQYMVRFVETGTADVYYIQFGTGNYFGQTADATTSSQEIPAVSSIYDAAEMHVYNICVDGVAQATHFAFNYWSDGTDGWILDNNGGGYQLAPWETGEVTSIDGNNDWKIYEVTLTELDDREAALAYATATYNTYINLSGTLSTSTTGEPGTYDADAVAAFEAALEALEAIDSPDADELTTDEINALADAVVEAYSAVTATWVSYAATVADGYYFIQTYPFFYTTTTTEDIEDPETGEVIPGESTTTYVHKSMSSTISGTSIYATWGDNDGTAPYLWKVTTVDADNKTYKLENMGTDAQLSAISTSSTVYMSTSVDTTVIFDQTGTVNDTIYYNIRMSGGPERGYYYAHTGGHSNGAGTSGSIVGWASTFSTTGGGSDWTLIPVSDEDAAAIIEAYAPYKDEAERLSNAEAIIEDVEPKLVIAEDETVNILSEGLITSADQFSSPYTETSEGSYEALLDGTVSLYNFWHSAWSGGSVDDGIHYLQVELTDPSEVSNVAFTMTRRPADDDHVTLMSVYGTNDGSEDVEKTSCTLLATISLPYGSNTETLTSPVFATQGFTYLRFYEEATTTGRGYWHMSEFQLYEAEVIENPTSQAIMMGDVYTNMVAAVEAAEAEGDDITAETYATLKEAYDAFIAIYVDPDTLRTAIDDATALVSGIVIGTNPGEWSSESVTATLTSLIAEATAYDAAGSYTPAQSAEYVADIEAAQDAILAAANPVEEGKWYNLRFASEELYESAGWSTSGVTDDDGIYPDLYDRLVAAGNSETIDEDEGTYEIVQVDYEEVALGQRLYLIDELELDNGTKTEAAEFRFIAVGDTAYIIQNRGTGLFLRATSTSSYVTLDIQPSLWKSTAMGYGKVCTEGTDILGNDVAYLHSQLAGTTLVTWTSDEVSGNTGLLIEYVEDVASDYDGTDFNMSVVPGNYYAYTYPVSVTGVTGSLYGVQVDETGTSITLEVLEDNTAAAGQPFIYIADIDDPDFYDADAEEEVNAFTHGYELNVTAGTSGRLIGTYESTTAPAGSVIPDDNTLAITKASSTTIAANSAWINAQIEDVESTLTVTVSEDTYTAITTAVENAVEGGDIYTIDGVKVGTGNLSSVKSLKKGLYIVNGTKVLVK